MDPLVFAFWIRDVYDFLNHVETELEKPWVKRTKDRKRREHLQSLQIEARDLGRRTDGVYPEEE